MQLGAYKVTYKKVFLRATNYGKERSKLNLTVNLWYILQNPIHTGMVNPASYLTWCRYMWALYEMYASIHIHTWNEGSDKIMAMC